MDMIVLKDISDRSSLENGVAVMDEIRQDGKVVLSSEDGFSIPMFFNNLCGKNFSGEKYRDYIKYIALGEMGFKPGRIEFYRDGVLQRTGEIPNR